MKSLIPTIFRKFFLPVFGCILIFGLTAHAQNLPEAKPFSKKDVNELIGLNPKTNTRFDLETFNTLCKFGINFKVTPDMTNNAEKAGLKNITEFLNYQLEKITDKNAVNPCKTAKVLLADFNNTDPDKNAEKYPDITNKILRALNDVTAQYKNVEIVMLHAPIAELDGSKTADRLGKKYNAAIVIWGNFTMGKSAVTLNASIQTISEEAFPINERLEIKRPLEELYNLNIQIDMARDLKSMTLLAMGRISRSLKDWSAAYGYLSAIISQPNVSPNIAFQAYSQRALTTYASKASLGKLDFQSLEADARAAMKIKPTQLGAYVILAFAFRREDPAKAIENGEKAIKFLEGLNDPGFNGGFVYLSLAEIYSDIGDDINAQKYANKAKEVLISSKLTRSKVDELRKVYKALGSKNRSGAEVDRVIKLLEKFDGTEADDLIAKARLANELGREDLGVQNYLGALNIDPGNATAMMYLSLHYEKWGNDEKAAGRPEKAAEFYKKAQHFIELAVKQVPGQPVVLIIKGQVYESSGEIDRSASFYKEAIAIDPDFEDSHLGLARVYSNSGQFDKAVGALTEFISKDPRPVYYDFRGRNYVKQHKNDLALADFKKALELYAKQYSMPDDRWWTYGKRFNLYGLRMVNFIMEREVKVLIDNRVYNAGPELCDKFVSLFGDQDVIHFFRSKFLGFIGVSQELENGDRARELLQEAMGEINKALDMSPGVNRFSLQRGLIWTVQGQYDKAFEEINKVRAADPEDPEVYQYLAVAHTFRGEYKKAIENTEIELKYLKDPEEIRSAKETLQILKAAEERRSSSPK